MNTTTTTARPVRHGRADELTAGINALLVLDLLDGLPGAGLNGELHDVAGGDLAAFAEHMDDTAAAADRPNAELASGAREAAARCRAELARR